MQAWLTDILQRIHAGELLSADYYAALDCDATVEARESSQEFDVAWMQAFTSVNQSWKDAPLEPKLVQLVEDIRREGFLAVSRATQQHEIASYVSDDLELIIKSKILGLNNPLADHLWHDYEHNRFPTP